MHKCMPVLPAHPDDQCLSASAGGKWFALHHSPYLPKKPSKAATACQKKTGEAALQATKWQKDPGCAARASSRLEDSLLARLVRVGDQVRRALVFYTARLVYVCHDDLRKQHCSIQSPSHPFMQVRAGFQPGCIERSIHTAAPAAAARLATTSSSAYACCAVRLSVAAGAATPASCARICPFRGGQVVSVCLFASAGGCEGAGRGVKLRCSLGKIPLPKMLGAFEWLSSIAGEGLRVCLQTKT